MNSFDAAVRAARSPRSELPPADHPLGAKIEDEIFPDGSRWPIATAFLRNGECPLACVYCGLYRETDVRPATGEEIARQVRAVRRRFPQARGIKLYNASSLFEPASIVQRELDRVAAELAGLALVVVEARSENAHRAAVFGALFDGVLEVAIGFETADDELLRRLNKPTSTAAFRRAAEQLHAAQISLRAFVLVQPPFVGAAGAVRLVEEALIEAEAARARVVSLLPVLDSHRPLEQLAAAGFFAPPALETVWSAAERALGRVPVLQVEAEGLDRLPACPSCAPARRAALANLG
ncbi:MAG: radical SAM protein, partial [Candidatus Binatia bacterium]